MRLTTTLGRLLGASVALAATAAYAQTVQYYTTGVFSASGASSATFGTRDPVTLTFRGWGSVSNPASATLGTLGPTAARFGEIVIRGGGDGASDLLGTLTVSIFQVGPTAGAGVLVGALTGALTRTAGVASLVVNAGTVTIDGTQYDLAAAPFAPRPRGAGGVIVQGTISPAPLASAAVSVPEPATLALFGTGLALVGVAGARRRPTG